MTPRPGFLACSKKFDPALFIDESWSAAEEDERANELAEIDVSMIALVTGLKKDEKYITGEEAVKRLKETPYIRLGGRAFLALWENQRLIPESWKEQFVFVSFDGLILLHRNGGPPPMKWSDSDYGFATEEDCKGEEETQGRRDRCEASAG